jgi:hypothetical protein
VSPFRPFLLPQPRVSPRAPLACSPNISAPCSSYLRGKARLFISLPPLCHLQKSQLLCNQANPASFAKIPGVGYPERVGGTPVVVQLEDASLVSTSPFRINTCKSVSKQTTLSSFRINTYEKPREGDGVQMPSIAPRRRQRQRRPRRSAAATFGGGGDGTAN